MSRSCRRFFSQLNICDESAVMPPGIEPLNPVCEDISSPRSEPKDDSCGLPATVKVRTISAKYRVDVEADQPIKSHLLYASQFFDGRMAGNKKCVDIPQKDSFLLVLKSLGIPEPSIEISEYKGMSRVSIEFVSNLDPAVLRCPKLARVSGDLCANYCLAEESAIRSTFDYLHRMHNVVVVDHSSRKVDIIKNSCRIYQGKLVPAIRSAELLINAWSNSLDLFFKLKQFPENNDAENNDMFPVFRDFILPLCRHSLDTIRSLDKKLKVLEGQMNSLNAKYQVDVTTGSKSFIRNGFLCETYILSMLLEKLNLPQADFVPVAENGQFIGALNLFLPEPIEMDHYNAYLVEASYPCDTLDRALNLAARDAILFLEESMSIEVVDFNHYKKVVADEQLEHLKDLNDDIVFLQAAAQKTWEDMLDKIRERISFTNGSLHDAIDLALANCSNDLQAVVYKYCSL